MPNEYDYDGIKVLEDTPELTCPYCKHVVEDAMEEGYGLNGDGYGEKIKCPNEECGKIYDLGYVSISYSFSTSTLTEEEQENAEKTGFFATL